MSDSVERLRLAVDAVLRDPGVAHLSENTIAELHAVRHLISDSSRFALVEKKSEVEFDIEFDDSVSPERALEFLATFAERLEEAGGRLYLRKRRSDP